MRTAGIRERKQNASAVVAEVIAGETVTITDRGRPVARLVPIGEGSLGDLIEAGRARPRDGSSLISGRLPVAQPGLRSSHVSSRSSGRTSAGSGVLSGHFCRGEAGGRRAGLDGAAAVGVEHQDHIVSSDLLRTELQRANRRGAPKEMERARAVLESITVLTLVRSTFERAAELEPDLLRSLDALHLAAALELGDDLEGIVTYDDRLAEAAHRYGIAVIAPPIEAGVGSVPDRASLRCRDAQTAAVSSAAEGKLVRYLDSLTRLRDASGLLSDRGKTSLRASGRAASTGTRGLFARDSSSSSAATIRTSATIAPRKDAIHKMAAAPLPTTPSTLAVTVSSISVSQIGR